MINHYYHYCPFYKSNEMSKKFRNKYRIRSHRLPGYDYSSEGVYFITIVTKNRKHFFGEITDGEMILNALGKMAEKFWRDIPQHFAFVRLDEFVIMPNHVHGVLFIDGYKNIDTDNVADNNVNRADNVADNVVETLHATSLRTNERNKTNGKNQKMDKFRPNAVHCQPLLGHTNPPLPAIPAVFVRISPGNRIIMTA